MKADSGAGKSRIVREFYERLRQAETAAGAVGQWQGLDARRRCLGVASVRAPVRRRRPRLRRTCSASRSK